MSSGLNNNNNNTISSPGAGAGSSRSRQVTKSPTSISSDVAIASQLSNPSASPQGTSQSVLFLAQSKSGATSPSCVSDSNLSGQQQQQQQAFPVDSIVGLSCDVPPDVPPELHWYAQWRLFNGFIRPYEQDRSLYRSQKYVTRPVFIDVSALLWNCLCENNRGNVAKALDGFLLLGFLPVDDSAMKNVMRQHGWHRFRVLARQEELSRTTRVSFEDEVYDDPADKIRGLEAEVRDLTRQVRLLRSGLDSTDESPIPPMPTIVTGGKPIVASTQGNSAVCLQLNFIDPDLAPYVVSLALATGRHLVPCSVIEHRFIVFVAPTHPACSVACAIFYTTSTGSLKRYAKSVWVDYRDPSNLSALSHHAVNQLMAEIPLPSSNTAPDPSEGATRESNPDQDNPMLDEDDTVSEALSCVSGSANNEVSIDAHPPLTREMLDLLTTGRPVPAAVFSQYQFASSNRPTHRRAGTTNSEISEGAPSSFIGSTIDKTQATAQSDDGGETTENQNT